MAKLPALLFYPGDWRKDPGVQALDYYDRGIWHEILLLMHESDERGVLLLNGAPMPEEALARLLGVDKQKITTTISTLLSYGVASRDNRGALVNRRMLRDEALRQARQKAGQRGGNPNFAKGQRNPYYKHKQMDNHGDKQKITLSSSSSSSSSSSDLLITPPIPTRQKLKPVFNPEGKTKFMDWVYLDNDQWKRVKAYYDAKGLNYDDLQEAIRELDKWFGDNPKMRAKRSDDAKALMGWPLDNALKRKKDLIVLKRMEQQK